VSMARIATRVLDGELVLATATADTAEGPFTAGACGFSEQDTVTRATSELAERTALLVEGPRRVASTAQARSAGGVMREIVAAPTAAKEWVRAEPVCPGESVWLPADSVLLRWQGSRALSIQQSSVGSAAHPDRSRAVEAGARECLERYAVRRIWSGTTTLVPITHELSDAVPASLLRAMERHGLKADAWLVGATLPAAVVIVMVGSAKHRVTFGASCGPTLQDGLRHALCEAVSVRAAFAAPHHLRRNFAMSDGGVDYALRTSSFQEAFMAFMRRLQITGEFDARQVRETDVFAYLDREMHVTPLVVDLGRSDGRHVVKVVVPAPKFFVPRSHRGYVLNPGYLE
jgi:ribosomal protein S12 methylthiotransferase accessory factor YcaO